MNARLGKRRNEYAARAKRKHVMQVANRLAQESGWRGDLAKTVKDVIDIDDCNEVYGEQR